MHYLKLFVLVFFLGNIAACSSTYSGDVATPPTSAIEATRDRASADTVKFVVKSAQIELEVKEPDLMYREVVQLVSGYGGFVESVFNTDQKRIRMVARVPQQDLERFLDDLANDGKVLSRSISARDVSNQMIDLDARVKNLEALRDRLRNLLDQAIGVEQVLAVETELSRIQTELDSIEARKASLQTQVVMSRVEISITRKTIYGPLGYLGKGLLWVVEKLFVIH